MFYVLCPHLDVSNAKRKNDKDYEEDEEDEEKKEEESFKTAESAGGKLQGSTLTFNDSASAIQKVLTSIKVGFEIFGSSFSLLFKTYILG